MRSPWLSEPPASGCPWQVTFPGPASEAIKIYLQRATKVFPVPVPRQTPAPPQSFPEPQPGPPPGFQGPECEIQVTTLTSSVAATRSEPLLFVFPGSAGVCHWGLLAIAVAQEPGWTECWGLEELCSEQQMGSEMGQLRGCGGSHSPHHVSTCTLTITLIHRGPETCPEGPAYLRWGFCKEKYTSCKHF